MLGSCQQAKQSTMIDLLSDTKTKPTAAMRQVMANAEVGDERANEDPSVNRLVDRCAELLGKEAALYLPSGTMCNEIALAVHCRPGDEVICDATSHVIHSEGGGPAALAGVMLNPIGGVRGVFSAEQLRATLRPDVPSAPRQRVVEVEQTANFGGGTIWPLATLNEVCAVAHAAGMAAHMDGARLLNAVVASGISAAEYSRDFDSVWIDFSKGLGAPGGAVLAGTRAFVSEANRWKHRLGGAMRQSGIIAAACEYALDHHVARLAEDHANAQRLAAGIARIAGLRIDPATVATNLVFFDVVAESVDAGSVCARLLERGVRMSVMGGPRTIRAVTHLDISAQQIDAALVALAEAVGNV
jgi:threonine aldolase